MVLLQRIATLETRISSLEAAADRNAEAFSDSLQVAEGMLNVFQRYQNDVINGRLRLMTPDSESRIDFQSYLVEYFLCVDILPKFIQWLTPAEVPAPAQDPQEEGAFVFGG